MKTVPKLKLKKNIVIASIILVVILVFVCILFFFNNNNTITFLENRLKYLAEDYYINNIKDTFTNINKVVVELESLESLGYDIDTFNTNNCNKKSTYALINIENPHELDKKLIKYKIEVYLDCDKIGKEDEK